MLPVAWRPVAVMMVLALLLLAGCGGPGNQDPGGNPPGEIGVVDDDKGEPVEGEPGDEAGLSGDEGGEPDEPGTDPAGASEDEAHEATAQPGPPSPGFALEPFITGLNRPVYLTHAGDGSGRLFIVEQGGRVRVWRDGQLLPEPFMDLSGVVGTRGSEQGLLSIAFPPDFADSGHVYVSYTARDDSSVLARWEVDPDDPDRVLPGSGVEIFRLPQPYRNHNGGLIKFGPDGYLYFGLGDGGGAGDPVNSGQDPHNLLGSMLRLHVTDQETYAIPEENPFRGEEGREEVWSFGLRNPWRFSFDRATGDLYIADVGQNHMEEINFQPAGSPGGENYGWSLWEGTRAYRDAIPAGSESSVTFPVAVYSHGEGHCSVTGGYVYRGRDLPALRGVYIYGDYCSGALWGLRRAGGQWVTASLGRTGWNITSFGEDEAGELYVVDHNGTVHRLVPGTEPVPPSLAAGGEN